MTAGPAAAGDRAGVQAALLDDFPAYDVWWDHFRPNYPVLVAQRVPGQAGHPHTVVTADPSEMRAILGATAPPAAGRSPGELAAEVLRGGS